MLLASIRNKTAGYYRHNSRLPIFVKKLLKKKTKKHSFFIISPNFSNFKRRKDILGNLPPLAILKKISSFQNKPSIFFENSIFELFEILLFQLHSTANVLQFGENVNAIGIIGSLKKRSI